MKLFVAVIISCLFIVIGVQGVPDRHTDGDTHEEDDEYEIDDEHEIDDDDEEDESDETIIARVKGFIDSNTCNPVSCGDHIGDEAHSFYTEFLYNGKRVIVSNQVPDHEAEHDAPSPNPNVRCEAWQFIQLPLSPTKATIAQTTGLGTIGLAITGGAFFNHLSNPDGSLAWYNEKASLDSCNGHSSPDIGGGQGEGQGPPGRQGPLEGQRRGGQGRPCQDTNSRPTSCSCSNGSTATFPTRCPGGPPTSCVCVDGSTWTNGRGGNNGNREGKTTGGRYHYHATINCTNAGAATGAGDPTQCLKIGYLRDGFPVYGYCQDSQGKTIKSCYRLKSSSPEGRMDTDYEYQKTDFCHLDSSNGGIHPVTGLYSYFMTEDYPYTPIAYAGTVVKDVCSVV